MDTYSTDPHAPSEPPNPLDEPLSDESRAALDAALASCRANPVAIDLGAFAQYAEDS